MQFLSKHDVYKDRVTGAFYTKCSSTSSVVLIDNMNNCPEKGFVLKPFNDHPDLDWSTYDENLSKYHAKEKFGYKIDDFRQYIFVTDDMFKVRFENIGIMYSPVDLDADLRHYESEDCDFSNRKWVAKLMERQLLSSSGSLFDCIKYVMYLDYMERTSVTDVDSSQLELFPD